MSLRVDVGIDADRDIGGAAFLCGDLGKQFQLGLGLDVDAKNALLDRERQFVCGLADAGEHDLVRRHAGAAGAQKFTLGDDVGAGAELGQGRDHRLVRRRPLVPGVRYD